MNVQQPSADDLARSLPVSWKDKGSDYPPEDWLEAFWQLADARWNKLPDAFDDFSLVPLAGGVLTSAAACSKQPALTAAHLAHFKQDQESVASLLQRMGCLCISEPRAYMVSEMPSDQEPITFALADAAAKKHLALQQFISEQRLGSETFMSVCSVLARLDIGGSNSICFSFRQPPVKDFCSSAQSLRTSPAQSWP